MKSSRDEVISHLLCIEETFRAKYAGNLDRSLTICFSNLFGLYERVRNAAFTPLAKSARHIMHSAITEFIQNLKLAVKRCVPRHRHIRSKQGQ